MTSLSETFRMWLLEPVLTLMKNMEIRLMSQLDDLNAAIQAEDVELKTILASITKVAADVDKLKSAPGLTPDLTNQIAAIQSHLASLTTGAQQLVDADTKANA